MSAAADHTWDTTGRVRTCLGCETKQYLAGRTAISSDTWVPDVDPCKRPMMAPGPSRPDRAAPTFPPSPLHARILAALGDQATVAEIAAATGIRPERVSSELNRMGLRGWVTAIGKIWPGKRGVGRQAFVYAPLPAGLGHEWRQNLCHLCEVAAGTPEARRPCVGSAAEPGNLL